MNVSIANPDHAETFVAIFKDIKTLTTALNLMFEEERLYIQSMDSAHVLLFEVILPKSWFDVYELTDGPITIGVDVNTFYACLQTRDKSQPIELEYKTTDDKLYIVLPGMVDSDIAHVDKEEEEQPKNKKKAKKTMKKATKKLFQINTVDLDADLLDIVDPEYDAEITILSADFSDLVNQLKEFGEQLMIECSETTITLNSGADNGEPTMSAEIPIDTLECFAINEGEQVKVGYSLKYLYNICKYSKLAGTMDIMIHAKNPMKIVYYLTNSDNDEKLVFYLAPRYED